MWVYVCICKYLICCMRMCLTIWVLFLRATMSMYIYLPFVNLLTEINQENSIIKCDFVLAIFLLDYSVPSSYVTPVFIADSKRNVFFRTPSPLFFCHWFIDVSNRIFLVGEESEKDIFQNDIHTNIVMEASNMTNVLILQVLTNTNVKSAIIFLFLYIYRKYIERHKAENFHVCFCFHVC